MALRIFCLYICWMPDKVHAEFHACPVCEGKGTVESRYPFRRKPCSHCGGRGIVTPVRRQQLLAKLKGKEERT